MLDIQNHGGAFGNKSKSDKAVKAFMNLQHPYRSLDWATLDNYDWGGSVAKKYDKTGNLLRTSIDTSTLGKGYIQNVVNNKIYLVPSNVEIYDFNGILLQQIPISLFTAQGANPFLDEKKGILKAFMFENPNIIHYREQQLNGTILLDIKISSSSITPGGGIFETITGGLFYGLGGNNPVYTDGKTLEILSINTKRFKLSALLVGGK